MLVLFFLGLGIGIVMPPINSLITGATSADRRGNITCLYGTVRFFGVAIGPPTFGLAMELGPWAMFLGSAALAVQAALTAHFANTPPAVSE